MLHLKLYLYVKETVIYLDKLWLMTFITKTTRKIHIKIDGPRTVYEKKYEKRHFFNLNLRILFYIKHFMKKRLVIFSLLNF